MHRRPIPPLLPEGDAALLAIRHAGAPSLPIAGIVMFGLLVELFAFIWAVRGNVSNDGCGCLELWIRPWKKAWLAMNFIIGQAFFA
jgi:hypothetical protein